MTNSPSPIEIRALAPADWSTVETLFGVRGACGGCWCMYWRVEKGGRTWKQTKGAVARDQFRALLQRGAVHAMLAFADQEPIGWCSFGPLEGFPRLRRSKALQRSRPAGTWAIICFYISPRWRGRAVATQLLKAAARQAIELGATQVEGYPAKTRPGLPLPAPFAWTGVGTMFKQAGFQQEQRAANRRDIYVSTGVTIV